MSAMNVEELYRRELEDLQALWEAGMWPALAVAINYCHAVQIPHPEWLDLAMQNILQDHYHFAARARKGAHSTPKGRLTMDYAQYLRWRAVRAVLREHGLTELPNQRGRPLPGTITRAMLLKEAEARLREWGKLGLAKPRVGDFAKGLARSFKEVGQSRAKGELRFKFEDVSL